MAAAPSSLTPSAALAAELRVVTGKLMRRLREQAQMGEFTLSQIAVLGRLEREGPATVTALARAEHMRSQSMGANIAALEAAGMVSGTPDPTDGRQTLWAMTDACRERIHAGRVRREDWLHHAIEAQLTQDEQRTLAGAVELLRRLTQA
jgi:DNA-binding MarR family transcriptional regulator